MAIQTSMNVVMTQGCHRKYIQGHLPVRGMKLQMSRHYASC